MDAAPPEPIVSDLAPGDAQCRTFDWSGVRVARIRTPAHPLFPAAYERLYKEFGRQGEMEREVVIRERLGWTPNRPIGGHAVLYEMLVVLRGEELVGVRDHTAIVSCAAPAGRAAGAIVHLSHVIVEPPLRGKGLAGWLRTFPIATGRECARAAGVPEGARVTLVAEMEPPSGATPITPMMTARLTSYERAGFMKIDPSAVSYCQPDFRDPREIDATGVRPVPLLLLIRRVGRESEPTLPGAEVREIISSLYAVFGAHVREDHMAPLRARLADLPASDEEVALRRPLQ